MQGFFIAKQTGFYRFTSPSDQVDNWAYLWTSNPTYSAWSDANTSFQSQRIGGPFTTGAFAISLNAGDAIPFTYCGPMVEASERIHSN
ncbi:hypothetical protein BKA66DRAFT_472281 [Pyrenochaeta sp. MPI-SDFR-AT-0127]|nr:hypothetical protein BKA66DRAFT_472281 [Pyrenochaeta sp. MPI-SDFR-AT-0127]